MENLQTHDPVTSDDYDDPRYKKFCDELESLGYNLIHYEGRFFFKGPAVIVEDSSTAMANTTVRCQIDNMGLDYVVYPKR